MCNVVERTWKILLYHCQRDLPADASDGSDADSTGIW